MQWELSEFGQQLCRGSGIGELMDDLGHALARGGDECQRISVQQNRHLIGMDRNAILGWDNRATIFENREFAVNQSLLSLVQLPFYWPLDFAETLFLRSHFITAERDGYFGQGDRLKIDDAVPLNRS